MARIRTIKPEFFTSEDIVSLSPMARLVYIALWCEADKEGRLAWKPKTFKLRYFPGDSVDIFLLCKELTDSGLVVLYGEGLAFIPTFSKHQHLNPRESSSVLPNPGAFSDEFDASARVSDASARVKSKNDAQGGREGKGKEGITLRVVDASGYPGFDQFWEAWPSNDRKQAKGKCLDAWKKASAERDAALVLSHVNTLKNSKSWTKDGGQFVPAPLVYLNNRRWEGAELAQPDLPAFAGGF